MDNFKNHAYEGYTNKMKNKLFGVLREREKNGEWEKFLESILIEIMEYEEERKTINYYILFYKLSACKFLRWEYFRKTIFECMNLFDNLEG